MPLNQNPVYNLKAALKETGIKPDVLRAWERRYGLPAPGRSPGGQRLYSSYDLAVIRWLQARQGEGLSISRAADLWNELVQDGRDPLEELAARPQSSVAPARPEAVLPVETFAAALRGAWLAACLSFDEAAADQALNQAFAVFPVETVCTEIIQNGMAAIGELWFSNRATVQQEHFATGLALRRLDTLIGATPPPVRGQTVLVGCPPDELHTFALMIITLFLRRAGFSVVSLGANVPVARFEETAKAVKAGLVILGAQQLTTAASLRETAANLSAHGVTVAYGGRIFNQHPNLRSRIRGHFIGARLDESVDRVTALLAAAPNPAIVEPGLAILEALSAYDEWRPSIEIAVAGALRSFTGRPGDVATANHFLGNNLHAALMLGDMSCMDAEIEWLLAYLRGQGLTESFVFDYLAAYSVAARGLLGPAGAPVIGWLDQHTPQTVK